MSFLEVNQPTPNKKLLSGGGDGVGNGHPQQSSLKGATRNPVPSCRRFCTRPPPSQRNENANVKAQLQKAIQELAAHPNITRRRALTMAEINPTRSVNNKTDGLQLSSPGVRGTGGAQATPTRKEDAGRRVCQLLLLNAWRRRRTQVATLSDSLGVLETQNGKLELQIDALRRLRTAECNKRAEAVADSQILRTKVDKTVEENEILKEVEEKAALEKEIKMLEERAHELQLELQNAQNDWMTVRCELRNTEHQLATERTKIKQLREEETVYLEQLACNETDIVDLRQRIGDLQDRLLNTELKLQDCTEIKHACENDNRELMETLNQEIARKSEIQKQLEETTVTKEHLEVKVLELRKSMNSNRESRKKLEEENRTLRKNFADVRDALIKEQQQPWWKNAGKVALASLNTLKTMIRIMLPAVPHFVVVVHPSPINRI